MRKINSSEVNYAPKPNQATWYATARVPELEANVTSCFGVIFYQDQIVLIKHISRGEEIPGGHREIGESVRECFTREIKEECAASELKDVEIIAVQEIKVLADKPENYKYPYPISYQVVFKATAEKLEEFIPNLDSAERILVPRSEIKNHEFYKKYSFLIDLAL